MLLLSTCFTQLQVLPAVASTFLSLCGRSALSLPAYLFSPNGNPFNFRKIHEVSNCVTGMAWHLCGIYPLFPIGPRNSLLCVGWKPVEFACDEATRLVGFGACNLAFLLPFTAVSPFSVPALCSIRFLSSTCRILTPFHNLSLIRSGLILPSKKVNVSLHHSRR